MLFDIRTAALDEGLQQRVRLAVSLLAAERLHAQIGAWDGTRCHLLIAAIDDEYGRRALALALRRGTPALALGSKSLELAIEPVALHATVASLAKKIRQKLSALKSADAAPGQAPAPAPAPAQDSHGNEPVLCQLARAPLRGRTVRFKGRGRNILIHPTAGRAYASSLSDLLLAPDALSLPGWTLREADDGDEPTGLASLSLEAFLLRAAWNAGEALPEFPRGRYGLRTWPDLGGVPQMVGALQIAKLLLGEPMSALQLRKRELADVGPQQINACLWAFAAADLLHDADDAGHAPSALPGAAASSRRPWWSAIARRFGLQR